MRCEVIVPCGPGHEQLVSRAMESVRVATLNKGLFTTVGVRVIDDQDGEFGRSAARNKGAREASGDYLFFLDADDVLHPDAFRYAARYLETGNPIDALWGSICELRDGAAVWRYQVSELNDYRELIAFDPYLTLQMGHFVKREVALENPFNEEMNCGEDWDYYLRLWKSHNCRKIREPLFINTRGHHSTGPKSATGKEWMAVVHPMLQEARDAEFGGQ